MLLQVDHYALTVQAIDGGRNPVLSSTVTVYINVADENDNSPIFDPSSYSIEVDEDAAVGSSLMQVAATDSDSREYCLQLHRTVTALTTYNLAWKLTT